MTVEQAFNLKIPQTEEEWAENDKLKKRDVNDLVHEYGPKGFLNWLDESPTYVLYWDPTRIVSSANVMRFYKTLREPIIHGLLRRSETMNIIAPPKSSKSWMGLNIAMNIIGGGKLFGRFQCERGKVLIIDNELHVETIAQRVRDVSYALNVPLDRAGMLIDWLPLRGQLVDLKKLEEDLQHIRRRTYNVIILDAFYKFYPEDFDENSNADMARIYTLLDYYAECLDSALILIHHSSKGGQGNKSVTDMGAGAGSQARACDAHLVLREHDDPGVFVIDCANRSFAPIAPFCARFKWPKWEDAPNSDPELLKGANSNKYGNQRVGGKKGEEKPRMDMKLDEKSRIEMFIEQEVTFPMNAAEILAKGEGRKFKTWSRDKLKTLVPELIAAGKLRLVVEAKGARGATYISTAASSTPPEEPKPEVAQSAQKESAGEDFTVSDNSEQPQYEAEEYDEGPPDDA